MWIMDTEEPCIYVYSKEEAEVLGEDDYSCRALQIPVRTNEDGSSNAVYVYRWQCIKQNKRVEDQP